MKEKKQKDLHSIGDDILFFGLVADFSVSGTEKWTACVEITGDRCYSYRKLNSDLYTLMAGVTFLAWPGIMLDASIRRGLTDTAPLLNTALGVSLVFSKAELPEYSFNIIKQIF